MLNLNCLMCTCSSSFGYSYDQSENKINASHAQRTQLLNKSAVTYIVHCISVYAKTTGSTYTLRTFYVHFNVNSCFVLHLWELMICVLCTWWQKNNACLCRAQTKSLRMSGYNGQPIPKLVGHLYNVLGHPVQQKLQVASQLVVVV